MKWLILNLISRFIGKEKSINFYFRKKGIEIGENCNICSDILTPEPYLISIGNNVTISNEVQFITHDNSISKVIDGKSDLFGRIKIGNNCFLGARCLIMYGTTLEDNTIVAAGSVVTRSYGKGNIIIGGVPAKIISNWSSFKEKNLKNAINVDGDLSKSERESLINNEKILIKR